MCNLLLAKKPMVAANTPIPLFFHDLIFPYFSYPSES